MRFDEYQFDAVRTMRPETNLEVSLTHLALGVTGEAGEIAEKVKKLVFHNRPITHEQIADEIGDVLWYLANMSEAIGISLETIAIRNVAKLKARYPNGFVEGGGIR